MAGRKETENPRRHPRRLWKNGADSPVTPTGNRGRSDEHGEDKETPKQHDQGLFGTASSKRDPQDGTDGTPPATDEAPSWWQPKSQESDTDSQHRHSHASSESDRQCVELCPICRTADVVRANAPPEFVEQWETFQHEALTILRSLIDGYMEHLKRREGPRSDVEDIPVE